MASVAIAAMTILISSPALAAAAPKVDSYFALGDSVAAGYGLSAGSETSDEDQLCARSSQAYPQLVAGALGINSENIACSGAKFDEGLYGEQDVGNIELPEQIARAFQGGTPSFMSITIGANDMRWRYFIKKCYATTCGTPADKALFDILLLDLRFEQWRMRKEVEFQSWLGGTNEPRTVITGYYNPFSASSCTDSKGIRTSEKRWILHVVRALNAELSRAASKEEWLHYAGVEKAFVGHRLCSDDSWVSGPDNNGRLHPTAEGQQAYAAAVLAKLG